MKHILYTTLFLFFSTCCFSQKNSDITGRITNADDEGLASGSAILYFAKDSVLTAFSITDEDGTFLIPKVASNDYYLQIDYVGYETYHKEIAKSEFDGKVDLGTIVLEENTDLEAIVVTNAPLEIRKDTITYDADAFQTEKNATVEDLLKKLPGIEVDQEGNIKAQGEDVNNVLVDGKKFFGGDPKVATKNLPADAVDKVSVYDKKSEKAEFTGVDDGEEEKTVDIQLKEDSRKGYFGNAEAAGGTEETYQGKGLISRYTPTSQIALLGSANNINEPAFTWQDFNSLEQSSMSGGTMNVQGGNLPRFYDNSSGIKRSIAGGTNLNTSIGKKVELYGFYFYNNLNNNFDRKLNREYFQQEGDLLYDEDTFGEHTENSHKAALDITYKLNKRNEIKLENSFNYDSNDDDALRETETVTGIGDLVNDNNTTLRSEDNNYNLTSRLYFKHRFQKTGRSLFAQFNVNTGDAQNDTRNQSVSEFYRENRTERLNQLIDGDADFFYIYGLVSYTEPVGEKQYLELSYSMNDNEQENDQLFYDIVNDDPYLNNDLTNRFRRDYIQQEYTSSYRIIKDKHNINAALRYETANIIGQTSLMSDEIDKQFNQLKPSLNWNYDIRDGSSLRFHYSLYQRLPSIRELQPVVDNSNPLRIYRGNPDLDASVNHRLRLSYNSFDQFTFTYYYLSAYVNLVKDPITQAQSFDENLVQTTTPINTDNMLEGTMYGSFSTPIRALRASVNVGIDASTTSGQVFLNGEQNDYNNLSHRYSVYLRNTNDEKISLYLQGNVTFNRSTFSENNDRNQQYINQQYGPGFTYKGLENWEFGSGFNYSVYSQESFADDNQFAFLRGYISRSFAENLGEIRLEMRDILNQNTGISRTQNFNYTEEEISNVLGRYGMLSLNWKIK